MGMVCISSDLRFVWGQSPGEVLTVPLSLPFCFPTLPASAFPSLLFFSLWKHELFLFSPSPHSPPCLSLSFTSFWFSVQLPGFEHRDFFPGVAWNLGLQPTIPLQFLKLKSPALLMQIKKKKLSFKKVGIKNEHTWWVSRQLDTQVQPRKKQEIIRLLFSQIDLKLYAKAWAQILIYFKQYSCVYSVFWWMVMNRYTQSQLSRSLHSRRGEFRVQETRTFDHCRQWCMLWRNLCWVIE